MSIGVAVVGCGYWGPKLIRNFSQQSRADLRWACDLSSQRLEALAPHYPDLKLTTHLDEVLADSKVDAVCIATPSQSHEPLAMRCLEAGRHVLVEKPLCDSSAGALRLIEKAEQKKRVLMVDHTFIYSPAVRLIRSLVDKGRLGRLLYFDSTRVNLGLFQPDVNVLWDLAVHDLAIMDFLLPGRQPDAVSATGIAHVPGQPENMAYLTCFYGQDLVAHIHANWLAPVKLRRTLLGGEKEMVVYDDLHPSERVKVYDKGISVSTQSELEQLLISYRSGDCWSPRVPEGEPLSIEVAHFIDCIENQQVPLSDGQAGLRVVQLVEAGSKSLKLRGAPVEL